ncbi:MAG: tripartite tricarboxylate transporter substrate binding protein [Burkholderiales bacterium]|nr:tripartite tricarboxylate transporter substrate binding protein [Burkholderiales bacterium]
MGRLVAPRLGESLGQQFIVENRAGAAGTIGAAAVAKSPPDGYTLLVASQSGVSAAPSLIRNLPYDPQRDLTPIVLMVIQPSVLVVHPSLPARTTKDFIALARTRPGLLTYGSSGIGATQHLSAELFGMMTGTELRHVPYKGGALAMSDLLGGHIYFMFSPAPTATPYLRSNRMRALAVTSLRRIESLPGVPTLDESGVRGYDFSSWIGLLGPASLPREIVSRLHDETTKAIAEPALRGKLLDMGLGLPPGRTPEEFGRFIAQDTVTTARVIKFAKVQPE